MATTARMIITEMIEILVEIDTRLFRMILLLLKALFNTFIMKTFFTCDKNVYLFYIINIILRIVNIILML